jgi:ankyrin repeat protein
MKYFLILILSLSSFAVEAGDTSKLDGKVIQHINKNKFHRIEKKFFLAAIRGDRSTVELCLTSGLDPNVREAVTGKTGLMMAAEKGHKEVVQLLIKKGADKKLTIRESSKEKTAYDLAEAAGQQKTAELLK